MNTVHKAAALYLFQCNVWTDEKAHN